MTSINDSEDLYDFIENEGSVTIPRLGSLFPSWKLAQLMDWIDELMNEGLLVYEAPAYRIKKFEEYTFRNLCVLCHRHRAIDGQTGSCPRCDRMGESE